jgi:hypothetical protein
VGAASVAVSLALIPGVAVAASTPSSTPSLHTRAGAATLPAAALARATASSEHAVSSPSDKSVRLQAPARGLAKRQAADAGTTIYATTGNSTCATDNGNGTAASPYCRVQDAVNAAVPGDTVDVAGSMGSFSIESVTVRTSDISIVGTSDQSWIDASNSQSGQPALILDGVTDVSVSNLMLTSYGSPGIQVTGSSDITLDSDYVNASLNGSGGAISIDGTSSGVTVSRTFADTNGWRAGTSAVSIAAGARNTVLTSDIIASAGISATGVNGLDITNDTIQRGCTPAVDIEGASTGVSIENNLFEDANPNTDYAMGGFQSQCVGRSTAWGPDVTVAAAATAGTTSDYNDFYVYGSDATAPYSWAGTTYPTLAAFRTGATQGAHDTDDSVEAGYTYLRPNEADYVDTVPQAGSAAITGGNPQAPGRASSDYYGTTPYTSRGAVQFASIDPNLAVGVSGQDTSAYGVSVTAQVTSTDVPLKVTFSWGDGTTSSSAITGSGDVTLPHTYGQLGRHTITVTVADADNDTVANSIAGTTAGSDFTAYGPARLLDTRNGTGAPQAKVQPRSAVRVWVGGNHSIPGGVTAAVLNVTVTDAAAGGFITAYADGGARPTTSNVNFSAGQTVPNQVIAPVGPNGYVDLYNNSGGTVDLIADIAGYFTRSAASGYTSLAPHRLIDTRNGTGTAKQQVPGHGSITAQIAGNDGGALPRTGVTAVALNVTATGSRAAGFLSVYPDGGSTPISSNVNFGQGQTIANAVVAPVGSDGRIRIANGSGRPTDVVVDIVGYYSAAGKSAYLPVTPTRLLDTRAADWTHGPLNNSGYIYMPVSAGSPDITAFVFNTTVTDTAGNGYLTVSPDPNSISQYQNGDPSSPAKPSASTLNWLRGQTVPNLVQASTGANGIIDFWNTSGGTTDLIVDAFGYYQND